MAWAARNLISTQVKTAERMVEAMKSEIAKKHRAEEGAGWQPVSALVRDALRATVVCPGAQAMCDVKAAFDASPLFTLKKLKNKICRRQVPFNLHAVYEFKPSSNDVSILVEIQIHDSEVRKASAAQQRFYQIFRAISSEKLHKVEAHHTMTHSKLMKQRSQRHMLRTAKISSSRALKALHRNFSVRNTGRRVSLLMRLFPKRKERKVAPQETAAAAAPGDDDATYETLLAAERGAAAARTQSRADSAARHKEAIARRLAKRRRGSFG